MQNLHPNDLTRNLHLRAWAKRWAEVDSTRVHLIETDFFDLTDDEIEEGYSTLIESLPVNYKLITAYPREKEKNPEENEESIFLRLGFKKLGCDSVGMLMGKIINGGSDKLLTKVPPPPALA